MYNIPIGLLGMKNINKNFTVLLFFVLSMLSAIAVIVFSGNDIQETSAGGKGENQMIRKLNKTDAEWKVILTPEQYRVMRKAGTERPFSGKYNDHNQEGIYFCVGCGTPLFSSETKYDHGTGWPSFKAPVDESHLENRDDLSHFMKRVEVRCAVCGAHLGHVFDDGPPPTYKHYCINSVALDFKNVDIQEQGNILPSPMNKSDSISPNNLEEATFAAGCFWGVEHKFSQIKGVVGTEVGYAGGKVKDPTYKQVCTGETGHAEVVRLQFDPSLVSYVKLLETFFNLHDPTQINRQGPDIGTQYRSIIFYHNEEQEWKAEEMIKKLEKSKKFNEPIATKIIPASEFFRAEEYHQKYYEKNLKLIT